jgi:hypothetical protein
MRLVGSVLVASGLLLALVAWASADTAHVPEPAPDAGPADASPENAYVVEGVSTGGLTYGTVSTHGNVGTGDIVDDHLALDLYMGLTSVTTGRDAAPLPDLAFTDLSLARVGGRLNLSRRVEVFLGSTFIAKQPSTMDEPIWQHAEAMARVQLPVGLAIGVDGSFGQLMGDLGLHWSGGTQLAMRHDFDDDGIVQLEGTVAGTMQGLALDPGGGVDAAHLWFVDVAARAELQVGVCDNHFCGGAWLGVGYRFPVAEGGPADDLPEALRFQDSAGMEATLGAIVPLGERWQLYLTVTAVDRGDAEKPRTEWPILDGGVDQTQVSMGLVRRFGFDPGGSHHDQPRGCVARGDCATLVRP